MVSHPSLYSHGGMVGGFKNWVERFPGQHFAVVVLSNMRTLWPDDIAEQISEFYLGAEMETPQPDGVPVAASSDGITETPEPEPFDPSPNQLKEYVGAYVSAELKSVFTLYLENGRLFARHFRHEPVFLRPTAADEFEGFAWFFPGVRFERNEQGTITGLRVLGRKAHDVLFVRRG